MRIGLNRRLGEIAGRLLPQQVPAHAGAFPGAAAGAEERRAAAVLGLVAKKAAQNLAAEQERWLCWCVVAFGAGIALYFALNAEPSFFFAGAVGVASLLCGMRGARNAGTAMRFLCALIAAGGLGFASAKLRTARVDAPIIAADTGPVRLTGRIESIAVSAPNKARIILLPSKLGEGRSALPRRVRLTLTGTKAVAAAEPGAEVSALAMLRPPPEPAMPHGYDFARWAYFHGIGGVGFTYGAPKPLDAAPPPALRDRIGAGVENLRLAMTQRIAAAIPGPDGSIAAALITGERGEIDEEDNQAYRDSGLAHVLSISGVHLALAGLGIFWAVRALLALWPGLALRYPIKKWAAVAAFASASFYLAISGGGAPAVRSYLMLSMMLLGVLADRPALSMRAVALAALALLAFEPEQIVDPSFQMSFAAVIGLIALAEWGSSRPRNDAPASGRATAMWWKGRRYIAGMLLASVVATLATTPFAIYHFDRAAAYSLIANLLAEPVVAFVIMPSAAIAVILMPVGFEAGPLHLMGWGVHMMTAIAHFVADLPGATTLVRAWPATALMAIVFGGLWIALWRLGWRWLGLVPILLGFAAIYGSAPPDLFIARDGGSVAVRSADGTLVILGGHLDNYTAAQWLLRDGDRRDVETARMGAHCDELGCVANASDGRLVALSLRAGALVEDCTRARIVVSAIPVRRACRGPELVLDRFDAARDGAAAVTFGRDGVTVETVAAERGKRPWSAGSGR